MSERETRIQIRQLDELNGPAFYVEWRAGELHSVQRCTSEDQARAYAAGIEEGIQIARRMLAEGPRLRSSHLLKLGESPL